MRVGNAGVGDIFGASQPANGDVGADGMNQIAPYSHSPERRKKFSYASHQHAGFADRAGYVPTRHGQDPLFGQGDVRWAPSTSADATRTVPQHRPRSIAAFPHSHRGQICWGLCDATDLSVPSLSARPTPLSCAPYSSLAAALNSSSSYLQPSPSFGDQASYAPSHLLSGVTYGSIAGRMGPHSMAATRSEATDPADLTAENYMTSIPPSLEPSSLLSPVSMAETPRSLLASPTSGFPGTGDSLLPLGSSSHAASRTTNEQGLPFVQFHSLKTLKSEGQVVKPTIHAHAAKNIFFQEGVWTCYRRNYIAVECSYTLDPCIDNALLYMCDEKDNEFVVQAIAVSLHASVDKPDGKSIELVQHTAKRDRGPQFQLRIEKLSPAPRGNPNTGYSTGASAAPMLPLQCIEEGESSNVSSPNPKQCQHTFERIQFKQATANNGRRRAQQQYYHLIVALYVDIRAPEEALPKWVKVAHQLSEPMVVRGRSPGHYQNEDSRASSSGPGSGSGGGAAGGTGGGPNVHGGSAEASAYTHAPGAPPSGSFSSSFPVYPSSYPSGSYFAPTLRLHTSPISPKRSSSPSPLFERSVDTTTDKSFAEDVSPFADNSGPLRDSGSPFGLALPRREEGTSDVPRELYSGFPSSFKDELNVGGASGIWNVSSYPRFDGVEGDRAYDFDLGTRY